MKRILCLLLILLLLPIPQSFAADSAMQELDALFTTADLMDATIDELLAAMDSGALTSERLTQMYLDRIEIYNPTFNTIISLNENALDEARAADERRAAGNAGRLNGIPILVKDNIDVEGMVTTNGSVDMLYNMAYSDAEVVALLRQEGAVILGKTNMAEHARVGANSYSTVIGHVYNAYDPTKTPAGSSGGSAVAVTCNFAAAALGTDTGSSLRRPASFANIYSIRPSFGLVSQDGLEVLSYGKDTAGPLCRTVDDLALMLEILTDGAVTSAFQPDVDVLDGLRIGYLSSSFGWGYDFFEDEDFDGKYALDDEVADMVLATLQVFTDAGAILVDMSDSLTDNTIFNYGLGGAGAASESFRTIVSEAMAEADVDVIIYLSQTDLPEDVDYAWGEYDNPASYICDLSPVAGLPDICIPMELSKSGLALGLDMVAEYGEDDLLLAVAQSYEQHADARVQPSTTPALPDEDLAEFAQKLLNDAQTALSGDYTADALDALGEAIDALSSIVMAVPEIVEGYPVYAKGEVDAVTYYQAVSELAEAYDALSNTAAADLDDAPADNASARSADGVLTSTVLETPATQRLNEFLLMAAFILPCLILAAFGIAHLMKKKQ